jgi:hypothetical protein
MTSYIVRIGTLLGLFAALAGAQRSSGYVFIAPGGVTCCGITSMMLQGGIGGEKIIGKGIGIGAEIAAQGLAHEFTDSVVGVFSANGYYHFRHGDIKADPFATGGYTMLFRSGHANLANAGGGFTYWFHHRLGPRVEVRDEFNTTGTIVHFWGARFGVAFR